MNRSALVRVAAAIAVAVTLTGAVSGAQAGDRVNDFFRMLQLNGN